jgi:transposase InsO family protein
MSTPTVAEAALAAGVSGRTAHKWLVRFALEGVTGLQDRRSVAAVRRHALPQPWVDLIGALRGYRLTAAAIAHGLGLARSTVAAVLDRLGMNRLRWLEPPAPVLRYERQLAGDLVHLDVKKLPRFDRPGHRVTGDRRRPSEGAGLDFIHVAIDDYSRLAYVEVLDDERRATTTAFLVRALRWFRRHGVRVRQVMSDNGNGYISKLFRRACRWLDVAHLRTRPRTPQTNGKAERFIQTMLREWAFPRVYPDSAARNAVLQSWLRHYNEKRPHASLQYSAPVSRVPLYRE